MPSVITIELFFATVLIGALAIATSARAKTIRPALGAGFLYYWSLYGAWFVIADKSGYDSGAHYAYLEEKMFAVDLDASYAWTIAYYAIFIVGVQLVLWAFISRRQSRTQPEPLVVFHPALQLIAIASLSASFLLIGGSFDVAANIGSAPYAVVRDVTSQPLFALHQVFNRAAVLAVTLGVSILAAGRDGRLVVGRGPLVSVRWVYVGLSLAIVFYELTLGAKSELFQGVMAALLLYGSNCRRPRVAATAMAGLVGLVFFALVDRLRGLPVAGMSVALAGFSFKDWWDSIVFIVESNEAFAAHFSLYGVLKFGIAPKFGWSIYSLAASIVPRLLWPSRPDDIYPYYAEQVGAIRDQGYTLHHAAGWYLNFGPLGPLAAALMLGAVWIWFERYSNKERKHHTASSVALPILFVSYIPMLIRSGIEGYKGLCVDAVVLPIIVLSVASRARIGNGRVVRRARPQAAGLSAP